MKDTGESGEPAQSCEEIGDRWRDADGDGYGLIGNSVQGCLTEAGWAAQSGDCNDADAAAFPGAPEACNDRDDNCDGLSDVALATHFTDADGDGSGDPATAVETCSPSASQVLDGTDCNDADATVHPGADELCNSTDDDCDGVADLGVDATWYSDADADGYGSTYESVVTCVPPTGWVLEGGDCRPTDALSFPGAAERCNGTDDDCDGSQDEDWDADGDGYYAAGCDAEDDCDDTQAAINPDGIEVCGDGVDDDCSGEDAHCGLSGAYTTSDADTLMGNPASAYSYLIDVGDLNDDGIDDVVSAYYGSGAVSMGPLVGTLSTTTDAYVWSDGARTSSAGRSIGLGDVDGDGVDDLGVGAPDGTDQGIFVSYGPITADFQTGDDSDVAFTLSNSQGYGQGGHGADLGDLDGDGIAESVMGNYMGMSGGVQTGNVHIAPGPLTDDVESDDAWTLSGEAAGSYTGRFIRAGVDVSGDGLGDVLIAGPYASVGAPNGGVVYLVEGPPSDMSLTSATARIIGTSASAALGEQRTMDMADVDGDGTADVLVAAYGAAFVGIFTTSPSGDVDMTSADIVIQGDRVSSFGYGITAADLDLDGLGDVLAGSNTTGEALLFYSPTAGSYTSADADASFSGPAGFGLSAAFADLDVDGHPDVVLGYGYGGADLWAGFIGVH